MHKQVLFSLDLIKILSFFQIARKLRKYPELWKCDNKERVQRNYIHIFIDM